MRCGLRKNFGRKSSGLIDDGRGGATKARETVLQGEDKEKRKRKIAVLGVTFYHFSSVEG